MASDTGYDTVKLYAEAMKRSGTTNPQAVARNMQNSSYQGASGVIEFDKDGGLLRTPVLYQVLGLKTAAL